MNKIMFEMQAMTGTFQFYASIDNDNIVEYEIDERFCGTVKIIGTKGKLDKERSKLFIDFIERADINNIDKLVEEKRNRDDFITYKDSSTFSISSFKYGSAFWNGYEELDNMHYIYLAILLCDEDMVDDLLGEAEAHDNLSSNIKDIMNNLGLKLSQDDEEKGKRTLQLNLVHFYVQLII